MRVLKWMLERIEGKGKAVETPIGFVPAADALTLDGLSISRQTMEELLRVDPADWQNELEDTAKFFEKFGKRLPEELRREHEALGRRLERVAAAKK